MYDNFIPAPDPSIYSCYLTPPYSARLSTRFLHFLLRVVIIFYPTRRCSLKGVTVLPLHFEVGRVDAMVS